MAPEQLTGQPPDARADIYSLGVVLYQLLAGRAPFTGDTMAIVSAHLTQPPPALRGYVPDLPAALDAVVLQALAKQPEYRFKSAGVFAQALRNAAVDLEPSIVRVVSAAPDVRAPTFSGVTLPQVAAGADQTTAVAPQLTTTGQRVAHYLPIILGVLGLLLLISLILKYWALVALLLILIGGGGFMFMYFRARAAGRKAAAETTRAISTSTIRAAAPSSEPAPATAQSAPVEPSSESPAPAIPSPTRPIIDRGPRPTLVLEDRDDVPEIPVPEGHADVETAAPTPDELPPTEAVPHAPSEQLAPTEAVPHAGSADLPPTEAVPRAPSEQLPPTEATEAVPHAPSEQLPPTEAVPASSSDQDKTEEH
jgi:hypothetical protein